MEFCYLLSTCMVAYELDRESLGLSLNGCSISTCSIPIEVCTCCSMLWCLGKFKTYDEGLLLSRPSITITPLKSLKLISLKLSTHFMLWKFMRRETYNNLDFVVTLAGFASKGDEITSNIEVNFGFLSNLLLVLWRASPYKLCKHPDIASQFPVITHSNSFVYRSFPHWQM